MDNLNERAFWKAFIKGNDRAFENIYKLYADRLFAFGMKYHADRDVIKDCLHDLFVNLFHYRSKLNPDVNPLSYLFTSLRNNVLARLRKDNRSQALVERIDYSFDLEWSPETVWIKKEEDRQLVVKLQQLIKRLPARQREVIYLKFNEELSYEEIASMLDISIASCRTLIYRAIKQLREHVEDIPLVQVFCLLLSNVRY
ncbi:sigma-70 family RNA polymerase sigma factor [Olivibacter sp. SA151]|uniref:RNA polymerase, sigma-24 subunit, ECF subfamily n=1 Tax=Sphingobacterium sp. (strain 21) TaxID=743722 RepID=F4C1Z1_SPHS2